MSYVKLDQQNINTIKFQTGDVLLFSASDGFVTKAIQCWTGSKYNHAAVVIVDPEFEHFSKKGQYLMESTTLEKVTDVEDHRLKLGVQMHPIADVVATYPGNVYWRALNFNRGIEFEEKVVKFHKLVHNDPYDLNAEDWIELALRTYLVDKQRKDEFICSALVSYFLVYVGALSPSTPWTLIRPVDLGNEAAKRKQLDFINGARLEDPIKITLPDNQQPSK